MHVAACVQPNKLVRLQGAAGDRHRVHAALDWAHADAIIRRQPVDVLVVDPQFDTLAEPQADRIRAVRNRYRSLPMIVYSVLAAQTLRPLVELGRDGLEQLVLYGLDDDPSHLRQMLERQPGILLSERLLDRLRRPLARVPSGVSHAVERLLRNPSAFRGVPDVATAAGVPRRSLYRHLARAGFVSPRELVAGARVLRAYAFLREPSYSLDAVASHVRFTDADAMTHTMKWGVGMTPGRARDRMGPDEFVSRLAMRLAPLADLELTGWPAPHDASRSPDA
ncbi:MAG TPA: AraC family transcriptional regulator [Gemmatimonadaceae bacterium]